MQHAPKTDFDRSIAGRLIELWDSAADPPPLAEFLRGCGPLSADDLRDAIAIDISGRWKRGEQVLAETYLAAYPSVAADPERAFDVVYAEIRARSTSCGYVDFHSLLQRFPEHRGRLEKQLDFNDWLGTQSGTHAQSPAATAAAEPWKTPELPDYHILGELGRGGMAVVFKAEQLSLGRRVALKMVLPQRLSGEAEVARFVAEAEVIARLDHPHIVPIYEVGRIANTPYFTMKLIDGPTLEQAQPRLAGNPQHIAALLIKVADGVHHAHQRGILHRDMKPANVLLDGRDEPSIVDFGLAKLLDYSSQLTASHDLVGTPCYLAPEQAFPRGRETVTVTTDVYGLGGILYFLLTGRPPFRGATVLETLDKLRRDDPIPPRQINPQVPRDVELICLKALEKNPSRRYTTALEFANDLRCFLDRRPTIARPISFLERLLRWVSRNPARAAAIVCLGAALTVTPAALWLHNSELSRLNIQLTDAVKTADAAKQQAATSETITRRLLYMADMKLAWQAWNEGDSRQYAHIMKRYADGTGQENLRCPAWRFLAQLGAPRPVAERTFENETLYTAAYATDPETVLAAGKRSTVWAVDATDGRLLWSLFTDQKEINSISLTGSRKYFATAGDDGTARIWDAKSRNLVRTIQAVENQPCYGAILSKDNTVVVTCGKTGDVKIWKRKDGTCLATLTGHSGAVEAMAISSWRNLLATAGGDGKVCLWDLTERKLLQSWGPFGGRATSVCLTTKDWLLAMGSLDGHVRVAGEAGAELLLDRRHLDSVQSVALVNRKIVASGDRSGAIRLSSLAAGGNADERSPHLPGWHAHAGRVYALVGTKEKLFSAGEDGALRIWRIPDKDWQRSLIAATDSAGIPGFCSIPRSRLCAVARPDKVEIYDVSTGALVHRLSTDGVLWDSVASSPDGKRLALHGRAGRIEIHDVATWQLERAWESGFDNGLSYLDWSAGSEFIVAGDSTLDDGLRIFRSATGEPVDALAPAQYRVAKFSNRGNLLAVTRDDDIELWDVAKRSKKATLNGHRGRIETITFSSDDRWMASGGRDRRALVWDLHDFGNRRTLEHRDAVTFVAFHPHGETLFSAGEDGLLHFWSLADGQETLSLSPAGETIHSGALCGDGTHLLLRHGRSGLRAIDLGE